DPPALQERPGSWVRLAERERQDQWVLQDLLDPPALQVRSDLKGQRDQPVFLDPLALRERPAPRDSLEQRAQRALQAPPAQRESRDPLGLWAPPERRDLPAPPASPVLPASRVRPAPSVPPAPLVLLAPPVPRDSRGQQV